MNDATAKMVREWLGSRTDEAAIEQVAKYMSRTLRIGGLRSCRALILAALAH